MKIRRSFDRTAGLADTGLKGGQRVGNSRGSSFQSQYRQSQDESTHERVEKLLEDINEQSQNLGKKIDLRELKRYKELISEFLQETVSNSHMFFKESVLDRRGRHRVWAAVKQVNDELENLTQEVLKSEKDNIKILKKIEDIRGLILDIVM